MKRTLFLSGILVAVFTASGSNEQLNAQASLGTLTGPALLDDWGNRFTSLGGSISENALRTQIRTTVAQLAMFDAVNAVLDGPYRPFASKPVSATGASPEAAAIRAAYIVALNEFPAKTPEIETAYKASIAGVLACPEAIARGIVVGEAAANAVLEARLGDRRNDPELEGYTPGSGPGMWIPTPPAFANPQTPFLRFVTPFGTTIPRASGQSLRQRSIAGATPLTTTRARTSVIDRDEPNRRAVCDGTVLVAIRERTLERQHPKPGQLDGFADRRSFRGHWSGGGDECADRLLGCEVHVHVLAAGHGDPGGRDRRQQRDGSGFRVDTLHRHAVAPRISCGSHHGRRERARVLHRLVRHRSSSRWRSRATAARFVTTAASRRSMPRKGTRGCGAGCTGATAPRWVLPSAARSASTPRRIS